MTTAPSGTAPGDYRAGLVDALRTIEQLRGRLKESVSGARALTEPIAVVGLGCRLPGGSDDPETFWRMLRDGVDATAEFPAERGDARRLYDPDPDVPGKAYTIRGGFLGRVDRFEPAVFGISPREALGMDPQQRLALEVAWEALEHAGYAPDSLDGSSTGVYLGVSTTDYVRLRQAQGAVEDVDAYQLMGEPSFAAGRISYTLGLRGPSKVIDTTCSSSLVAVHEACQALRTGECDMALAGGVNLMLAPYGFVLMSKFRALSPDGRCKTFDAAADGYARGEGAGIVTLKRLSDAVRDGDHIAAVIRGSAIGHDGRSSGLTVPNPAAQQQVIKGALAQASIAPADVDYLEAHGTGTALGDPIELRALQAALARHRQDGEPLLVGSVKTNIGHLESAAGIAGLIKLILCLQHAQIPPHLHFDNPNPNVDWSRLQIEVTARQHDWPDRGRDRIGAISSFGASGTNAHAVVSSAPPAPAEADAARTGTHRPHGLLLASARTPEALRTTAESYARLLRRAPQTALADICWTTQVGRARQQHGLAAVGDSLDALADSLEAYVRGEDDPALATAELPAHKHRKTAWLFTGQGAQYPGMGAGLLEEPAFREAFEECERLIDPRLGRPLRAVLWPQTDEADPADASQQALIDDTRFTQPALFALEFALARMWMAWGHRPGALLGHSIGEIAAAAVAGVFSLDDACRLVVARAALMAALPAGGAMAAVHCSEATARAALEGRSDRLAVAAVNGPEETVLSGDADELAPVLEALAAQGVRSRRLSVSHAFHSPLLEPMLKEFREVAEEIDYRAPALPLLSNVTGRPWTAEEVGAAYWVRHAASAVRFHDGVRALHSDGYRTFLEIGPAPVLAGIGDRALEDADCAWIPSLRPAAPGGRAATADGACVRQALGVLRLRGADPDWTQVHRGEELRRVPLPTTPWRGESYWFTDGVPAAADAPAPGRDVPGVGRRLRTAVPTYELDLDGDHWVPFARTDEDGFRYAPLGALAEVTVAAATDALGGSWACVEEIDLLERLPLAQGAQTVHVTVAAGADGRAEFTYRSLSRTEEEAGAPWRLHVRGVLRRHPLPPAARPDPVTDLQVSRYTDRVEYEPAVLSEALVGAVTGAHRGAGGVLVALDHNRGGGGAGWMGVGVMDASVAALSWDAGRDRPGAAVAGFASHVGILTCADPSLVRYVRATARPRTGLDGLPRDEAVGEVEFFAEDGSHIGGIGELRVVPASAVSSQAAPWRRPEELLTRIDWQQAPTAAPAASLADQSWLLVPDRGQVAAGLARELESRGAHCLVADTDDMGGARPDPAAIGALLTRWREQAPRGAALRAVLCTALDAPQPEEADPDVLQEYRDRTELTAVALVQQLLETGRPGDRVPVGLVTRGAQAAGSVAGGVDPFGAALWGLGRVIALEHAEHWGGSVDLDPLPEGGADGAQEARLLLGALTDPGEDQQALRGAERYVARLVPHPLTPEEQRALPPLRSAAAYLVTGAFGGIGQVLCRWLAANGAGKLVLLGRSPLPDRADWDAPELSPEVRRRLRLVRDLEAMGVVVEPVVADVADPVALARVIEDLSAGGRPLRGVVHAAGTSVPQFLRDIPVADPRDYDAVWRPKVVGGWLLHQLTDGLELDFFLNFSSIAATWGSQHLSSYSAANAFLDGLAEHRHARGLPALTVSWGPWDLASNLFGDDVLAFLTATGLRTLSAPQCLRLLGALLAGKAPQAVVCAADWSAYKPVMEARSERPLLRTVEIAEEEGQAAPAPVLESLGSAGGRAGRRALLVPYLQQVLGEVLGVPPESLTPETDVLAGGLDSLMVMEVVKRCKRDLRVSVRPNQFFERTALEDWAVLLADATAVAGAEEEDAPAAVPTAFGEWADPARIARDVTLDPDIRPGEPPSGFHTAPREVLLTGATGFLGAYLLDELLATTDAVVHCLVRCADPEQGLARIRANSEQYLPWRRSDEQRISVLPGDLAQPLLGLSPEHFEELGPKLDAIYHNGALVNFSYTYEQSRAANLAGTQEILRLACRGPLTPVSHVSTYGIWGLPADGRTVITEDDPIDGAGKLVTGYVQTKWAAERLAELARERGIPVDVHRPGRVLGDSRSGACLTTHFTTRVIKGCIQLGLAPALDIEIEMTPVDYVTRAMVRISREEHPFGSTYHLVNRRKMRFQDLVAAMVARGWEIATIPTGKWWDVLRAGFAEQENELHAAMEVVEEFVVGGEEAIDYDATHAERALGTSGISCPPLDEALLDTYFDWMIRSGYLPDPAR